MRQQQKSDFLSSRVHYLPVDSIRPNPHQPRKVFSESGLRELAESIRQYGILQPLTVRRCGGAYELVAGERRLRAAGMAGLKEVPCLLARVDEEDSALLALIENLQRRDLDCWEEAEAIARLISLYRLTQEQAAERIGKSQSAVANKLRLLRLSQPVRRALQTHHLSERHARALLRLEDEHEQLCAVHTIVQRQYNVARTEEYIEELLEKNRRQPPQRRTTYVIKDVRLFLNSVERGLRLMQQAGVAACCGRQDTEEEILLHIRIPRRGGKRNEKEGA